MFKNGLHAVVIASASLGIPNMTQAGLTFELKEVGSDVVLTLLSGGSIDLSGFRPVTSSGSVQGRIDPSRSLFWAGSNTSDFYDRGSATGPSSFGSSSVTLVSSSDSGDFVAFEMTGGVPYLAVPYGYVSGSTINASSTSSFQGQNFSTLGVTLGTYVWTLGNSDTIRLNIIAAPVPEASASVAGFGLAVAGLYQLRRRRQNTVTQ